MAEIDLDRVIRRVLHRAEDRFDAAIRALGPEPVPREPTPAEVWQHLAVVSHQAIASLFEGVRRASIALPILAFGTPDQKRMVERALRGASIDVPNLALTLKTPDEPDPAA